MIKKLKLLLEYLEGELDPDRQFTIIERHKKTLNWEPVDKLPLVITFPFPEKVIWQPFPFKEAFEDQEKMLYNELVNAFDTSIVLHKEVDDDLPYTIRVNFGTVVIASLFGGNVEQRENNPPWVRKLEEPDAYSIISEVDPFDFSKGLCGRLIDTYEYFNEVLSIYPVLNSSIKIVLPDLQGPVDTLEMLRGSELFMDFITNPEIVHDSLDLMATAQIGLAKHLQQFTSDHPEGFSFQHAMLIKGNILIRDDSVIMISPEMYREQVAVHDEKVLNAMAGGGIHSCGKIDFCLKEILKLPSINCFDFGQSYLNDVESIYYLAKERKTPLIRVQVSKRDLVDAKIKDLFPTGISLIYPAVSYEEAKEVSALYTYHI